MMEVLFHDRDDHEAVIAAGLLARAAFKEGERKFKKDVSLIMLTHSDMEYVATTNVSYSTDFIETLKRAEQHKGTKSVQLYSLCLPGWCIDASKSVEVGKLAVENGMWVLYGYENQKLSISQLSKPYADSKRRKPLKSYLKMHDIFSKISDSDIKELEEEIDKKWAFISEVKLC